MMQRLKKTLKKVIIFVVILFLLRIIDKIFPLLFLPKEEMKNDTLIVQHTKFFILEFPFYIMKVYNYPNFGKLGLKTHWYLYCYPSTTTLLTVGTDKKNENSLLFLYDMIKKEIIWSIRVDNRFSSDNTYKICLSPTGKYILWITKKRQGQYWWMSYDICELHIGEFIEEKKRLNLKWIRHISNLNGDIKLFHRCGVDWSPDERKIFIIKGVEKIYKTEEYRIIREEIVEIDISSGKYRVITEGKEAKVSPDGEKIAVVSDDVIKIFNLKNSSEPKIIENLPFLCITSIIWSRSSQGIYCIGNIKNSMFWGVYYISLNNLTCYRVRKVLWLYWGGAQFFQPQTIDNIWFTNKSKFLGKIKF